MDWQNCVEGWQFLQFRNCIDPNMMEQWRRDLMGVCVEEKKEQLRDLGSAQINRVLEYPSTVQRERRFDNNVRCWQLLSPRDLQSMPIVVCVKRKKKTKQEEPTQPVPQFQPHYQTAFHQAYLVFRCRVHRLAKQCQQPLSLAVQRQPSLVAIPKPAKR